MREQPAGCKLSEFSYFISSPECKTSTNKKLSCYRWMVQLTNQSQVFHIAV